MTKTVHDAWPAASAVGDSLRWKTDLPTEAGFYYWQDGYLQSISKYAVRIVQVSKYKTREGFRAETLTGQGAVVHRSLFNCDLVNVPAGGRWAGPLPQPYE